MESLTARQLEIVKGIASSEPRKAIAHRLGISRNTVEFHAAKVKRILGLRGVTEAVLTRWAVERGLVSLAVMALALFAGCRAPTPVSPNAMGCAMTFQALGNNLVAFASYTNAATGDYQQGMSFQFADSGGILEVDAGASITCSTNLPMYGALSFICHGTNLPNSVPLYLPIDCDSGKWHITFDCKGCSFGAALVNSNSCGVMSPKK